MYNQLHEWKEKLRYLITGHNGFKGSWLSLFLKLQGHDLYGLALEPIQDSHYRYANLGRLFTKEVNLDIRRKHEVVNFVKSANPEVVVHLAAQPLVSIGYSDPFETFSVNVDGTQNVLESVINCDSVKVALIVTTDKVYRNTEKAEPFEEADCLGGKDPYSASKSMADILTQSVSRLFPEKKIVIARAGNVVGGGDYAKDRLIPDLVRSANTKTTAEIRSPNAVRPWQHVLDCLNGYLSLIEFSLSSKQLTDPSWNFGPEPSGYKSVDEVIGEFRNFFGLELKTRLVNSKFEESKFLTLNSTRAKRELNWSNKLDFSETIKWTAHWYQKVLSGSDPLRISEEQVQEFCTL